MIMAFLQKHYFLLSQYGDRVFHHVCDVIPAVTRIELDTSGISSL